MKKIILIIILCFSTLAYPFAFHFRIFPKITISGFTATGGIITYLTAAGTPSAVKVNGGYTIHTFTSGTTNFVTSGSKQIEYLIVAGGGGMGQDGGSGGAGGMIQGSTVISNNSYSVIVGNGGGYIANGGNSSFNGLLAYGGGSGGGTTGTRDDGASGGSGGGGGDDFSCNGLALGGSGFPGQGNSGGDGWDCGDGGGGGGGGAGGSGQSASNGGAGGAGLTSSISGTAITYARGGSNYNGPYWGSMPNTGNGAGADRGISESGIVIIRYQN